MGTVQDASTLNGVVINSNNIYFVSTGSTTSSGTNGVNTYSGTVTSGPQATFSGTIADTSTGGNGSISITSSSGEINNFLVLGSSADGQNLVIRAYNPASGQTGLNYIIANNGTQPTGSVVFNSANGYNKPTCFAAGTLIATPAGDIAVEHLAVGDIVLTAEGNLRPIRWIGRRAYDCRTYIKPSSILPVLIAKDAVAPGVPSRDTLVSEGHAIALACPSPVFVPARSLINGETIRQITVDSICYYHIELDEHEAVLANNLPAETYLDCGTRSAYLTIDAAEGLPLETPADPIATRYPRHDGDAIAAALHHRLATRARIFATRALSEAA